MSEKEYIERGALIAFVSKVRKKLPKDSKDFFTRDEMLLNFQQYVDAQPAADVEPVVRGELRINDQGFLECSACGKTLRMPLTSTYEMKRCYICGAHLERSGSGE